MNKTKRIQAVVVLAVTTALVGSGSAFAKSTTPSDNHFSVEISPDTPVVTDELGNDIYQNYELTFTTSVFDNYDLSELSTDSTTSVDTAASDSTTDASDNSSN